MMVTKKIANIICRDTLFRNGQDQRMLSEENGLYLLRCHYPEFLATKPFYRQQSYYQVY